MADYVTKIKVEGYKNVSLCFYIENDKVFKIGQKMYAMNQGAYMNGYNWEAFFQYYLAKYFPDLLQGMDTDSEAGMYVAFYEQTPENEAKVDQFVVIIEDLVENESKLYDILNEDGAKIKWDSISIGGYISRIKSFFLRILGLQK